MESEYTQRLTQDIATNEHLLKQCVEAIYDWAYRISDLASKLELDAKWTQHTITTFQSRSSPQVILWKVPNVVRAFSTVVVSNDEGAIVWESCRLGGNVMDWYSVGLVPACCEVVFVNVYIKLFYVKDWGMEGEGDLEMVDARGSEDGQEVGMRFG